jgi:cytochrome bd-type quinol oxidase subunit 2
LKTETTTLPAIAIRSVATGLFMMTVFTFIWTGIAFGAGLQDNPLRFGLVIFVACMIFFVVQGIRFLGIAKKYPSIQSAQDAAEGKKMGMWFGIIFGAEGLFIFLAINLVKNLGHEDLIIPAIALVVGLHFYPMAKIFNRKIDYWLATWSTVVALCGIIFILKNTFSPPHVYAMIGISMAITTSCYGLYMIYYGNKMIRENPIASHTR